MADSPSGAPAPRAIPPSGTPAPSGNRAPAPSGAPAGQTVVVDAKQYRKDVADAARYRALPPSSKSREQRYAPPATPSDDDGDPEKAQLASQNQSLLTENMKLKVSSQLSELLKSDEYKALPEPVKRLIRKNPMAYVDERAKTPEQAILDIRDVLDEELEKLAPGSETAVPGQPAPTPQGQPTPVTPPATVAPPNSAPDAEVDVTGLSGPARSQKVLKGLLKKKS